MILDQQFDFRKLIIGTCLYKSMNISVSSLKNPWYCYEHKKEVEDLWVRRLTIEPISNVDIYNTSNINIMFIFNIKEQNVKCTCFFHYIHINKTIMYNTVYNKILAWKNLKRQ